MSKLHKSIILVLFVVLAFAAFLAPASHLLNNSVSVNTGVQTSTAVAYTFPTLVSPDGGFTTFGFTWAG